MAKCRECRKKIRIDTKNCPYCGALLKGRGTSLMTALAMIIMLLVMGTYFGHPG